MNQSTAADTDTTLILYGAENIISFNLHRFSRIKEKQDAFVDSAWPSVIFTAEPIKNALIGLKKKGIKQRTITEITIDNVAYCKELMKIMDEMRHMDGIKGNFSISDESEYVAIAKTQKEQEITQLIYSNAKQIVEQHQYLFETLWNKAIPAKQRMKEIEQGIKREFVETIREPIETQELFLKLVKAAKDEILLLLSTPNAFHRVEHVGLVSLLGTAASKHFVDIRVLVPLDNSIQKIITDKFNDEIGKKVYFHFIFESSLPKITALIVDSEYSLIIDTNDDSKRTFNEAVGLSTYSNIESTVAAYTSIFESLWTQSELKEHNTLKKY